MAIIRAKNGQSNFLVNPVKYAILPFNYFQMARMIPVSSELADGGKSVAVLRERLKVPRTVFATLLGIGNQRLESYEAGRVPMPPDIARTVKKAARAHLAECLAAFETAFGQPAFDLESRHLNATRPPTMKLQRPLTDHERAEITGAQKHLGNVCQLLRTKSADHSKLETDLAAVVEELAAAKRGRGDVRKLAETINVLETQIKILEERQGEAVRGFEQWRRMGAKAIVETGELIERVARPLIGQFQEEVGKALAPFYATSPVDGPVKQLCGSMDAYSALLCFLRRGIGFSAAHSAEDIIETAEGLRETLDAILSGRDIFTFQRPATATL